LPALVIHIFEVECVRVRVYLFIMKFVQLGTQIKTRCEKKYIQKNTKNEHYEVHKNHIIKSTSDSLNSEI